MTTVALHALPWGIMVLYLIGGQIEKGARRYGVPGLTTMIVAWKLFQANKDVDRKESLKALIFLPLIGVLAMGYGVNSSLMAFAKKLVGDKGEEGSGLKELTTRLLYAIILSLPLMGYTLLTHIPIWKYLVCLVALIGAFQVHTAKTLWTTGDFNVLVDDIIRSLTLGYCIVWLVSA